MTTVAELYQLQETDLAWANVRRRLLQIQELLQESEELKALRQQVEDTEAHLHEAQAKQLNAELETQGLKEKIAENNKFLMGGTISNPKELEALQSNEESLGRQLTIVEETAVEALFAAEQLRQELEKLQETLQKMEAEWGQGQQDLSTEGETRKKQFLLLKQRRGQQAASMDPQMLGNYESLRKRKQGVAIAKINDDSCGACHMALPTGVIGQVRAAASMIICPSCGRILYDA